MINKSKLKKLSNNDLALLAQELNLNIPCPYKISMDITTSGMIEIVLCRISSFMDVINGMEDKTIVGSCMIMLRSYNQPTLTWKVNDVPGSVVATFQDYCTVMVLYHRRVINYTVPGWEKL